MIFEIIRGGGGNWVGKNGPAYFFAGERMGRPILSPGKNWLGGNSGLLHREDPSLYNWKIVDGI